MSKIRIKRIQEQVFVILDEIIRDKFGMSFDELWLDMGFTNENKTELIYYKNLV